jgi:hypothetical protein
MSIRLVACAALSATVLCGCTTNRVSVPEGTAVRTGNSADENACLDAVKKETQNNTASVITSELSEAATLVMVVVGSERAPWRCLVSGGVVSEVSFAGSEGKV